MYLLQIRQVQLLRFQSLILSLNSNQHGNPLISGGVISCILGPKYDKVSQIIIIPSMTVQ